MRPSARIYLRTQSYQTTDRIYNRCPDDRLSLPWEHSLHRQGIRCSSCLVGRSYRISLQHLARTGRMVLLADGSENSSCFISSSEVSTSKLRCSLGVERVSDRPNFLWGDARLETELGLCLLDGRGDSEAVVCAFRASLTMRST